MAHVDAGKTTLTERILFNAGRIHKIGNVDDGNTEMDSRALEQKHGITISAAATSCHWNNTDITIIDTPGHLDFTMEVERSLRVLDSAVAVFSSVAGVEPQSETVWRQAQRFGVPRICFVNKMDLVGANFEKVVTDLASQLSARPLVLQIPIGAESGFVGIVDLIAMKSLVWNNETGHQPVTGNIADDLLDLAHKRRKQLVEQLVELDDTAFETYLEKGDVFNLTTLQKLVRLGCVSGKLHPVLCGSAQGNIGVQPLLDAIAAYCPAPEDRPAVQGTNPETGIQEQRAPSNDAPLSLLVAKVQMSQYGALSFVRVYSGTMRTGDQLLNTATGNRERIGRILRMHANEQTDISEAIAGDVVAIVGLKATASGQTLCHPSAPIVLDGFECPEPVISAVIEPKKAADAQKLGQALARLKTEDPSLRVTTDPETGQTLVAGMGELHLMIALESLKEEHNVEATLGEPRVSYREALTTKGSADYTHRKQNGGVGQMARVHIVLEPTEEPGLHFESKITGGAVPRDYIPAIEKALQAAMNQGELAGYPVLGVQATLVDGAFHSNDSSALAFELATREAFRRAFMEARPVLLEPVMDVIVTVPAEYVGAVMGDLQGRRGRIDNTDTEDGMHEITASVPLANMFSYVNGLRSRTQGRGTFTMAFGNYAPVPHFLETGSKQKAS